MTTLTWIASERCDAYYWRNADDTLEVTIYHSIIDGRWHWQATCDTNVSGRWRRHHASAPANSAAEALAAAERWIAAQAGG